MEKKKEKISWENDLKNLRYGQKIDFLLNSWSGQVMEPMDSLAFIGRNPADNDTNNNHIYIATGDSGNGITQIRIVRRMTGRSKLHTQ
jgi:glycine/D-amino acid oxidase-like deaminating enzyme